MKKEAKKCRNKVRDMEHKNLIPDRKIGNYETRDEEDVYGYPRTLCGEVDCGKQAKHR